MKKIFLTIILLLLIVSLIGCSTDEGSFIFQGMDEEWSIELPDSFEKYEEEKQEDFYFIVYKNEKGDRFIINEVVDKDTVVNEEIFEKEIVDKDSYFQIKRVQTINIEGLGKVYGAIIEDRASEGYMIYFKMRINDKVISFVASKNRPFSVDEEAKIISIISNIKIK